MRPARLAARVIGSIYLGAVAVSCVVRHASPPRPLSPDQGPVAAVHAVDGERVLDRTIRLAYLDTGPKGNAEAPVVVLLHGSPGDRRDFSTVVPELSKRFRVIVPDLPGFGASERDLPDYSFHAHARYVLELLDELGIDDAHVVGYSMGGGVALSMAEREPRRLRSIAMISAVGVQELDLLGSYELNHVLHGAQLAGAWGLHELTPHFGILGDAVLGVPFARNAYDSDQRPLREVLARWQRPMLIVHGERDPVVPIQTAREHARLVPQSELIVTPESHFMVVLDGPQVAATLETFFARVERGEAVTRAGAAPDRVAAAAAPFDPSSLPRISGFPWFLVLVMMAVATLFSEDLTCIGAGLLVTTGRLDFVSAVAACSAGIVAGDVMAFVAGRVFGRAALARAPMKWMVTEEQLQRASEWFRARGPVVILASRFLPGTRVATFLATGVLRVPFFIFALWFGVSALLWTPLLVGTAALVGAPILGMFHRYQAWAVPLAVLATAVTLLIVRVVPRLVTTHGRASLVSVWKRASATLSVWLRQR